MDNRDGHIRPNNGAIFSDIAFFQAIRGTLPGYRAAPQTQVGIRVIRMRVGIKWLSQELFLRVAGNVAVFLVDQHQTPAQVGFRDAERRLIEDGAEPVFTLTKSLLHPPALGEVEYEADPRGGQVTLERSAADQNRDAAAVFSDELLFIRRKGSTLARFLQGAFVQVSEFGRCHLFPIQPGSHQILGLVTDGVEKALVGAGDHFRFAEDHTNHVGLHQSAEFGFAYLQRSHACGERCVRRLFRTIEPGAFERLRALLPHIQHECAVVHVECALRGDGQCDRADGTVLPQHRNNNQGLGALPPYLLDFGMMRIPLGESGDGDQFAPAHSVRDGQRRVRQQRAESFRNGLGITHRAHVQELRSILTEQVDHTGVSPHSGHCVRGNDIGYLVRGNHFGERSRKALETGGPLPGAIGALPQLSFCLIGNP